MKMRAGFGAVLLAVMSFTPLARADGNVILITIDGVRFQDFFGGVRMPHRAELPRKTVLFPEIQAIARRGEAFVFGDRRHHGKMWVANTAGISLPGYRGILSGEFEDRCRENDCPNIDRETIFDSLAETDIPSEKLGAIASWGPIGRALQSRSGKIARSVAFEDFPEISLPAGERRTVDALIELARKDVPEWYGSRKDIYTYELGLRYLQAAQPRFFYWSFVDSDEYAHLDEYRSYAFSLLRYDQWIGNLRKTLARMGKYGDETSIIVTTDHGRYPGPLWTGHGGRVGGSLRTWAVVIPSARHLRERALEVRKAKSYSHVDIRPTIEMLLDLPNDLPSRSSAKRKGKSLVQLRAP
jgi:hypothetical protein